MYGASDFRSIDLHDMHVCTHFQQRHREVVSVLCNVCDPVLLGAAVKADGGISPSGLPGVLVVAFCGSHFAELPWPGWCAQAMKARALMGALRCASGDHFARA